MNPHNKTAREAFVAIGQAILKADSAEDVITCFEVLKGDRPIIDLKSPSLSKWKDGSENVTGGWSAAVFWVNWWLRKSHLRKSKYKIDIGTKLEVVVVHR